MDKRILKDVLANMHEGDELNITFTGSNVDQNGNYHVLSTRRWKGKGGSMLANVINVDTGTERTIGTPYSTDILNLTFNGEMYGTSHEEKVERSFEKSRAEAMQLKEAVLPLVGTAGAKVAIESTEPEFNGEFTVISARKSAGKFGQIKMMLQNELGNLVELWTYRHATAVQSFEILEAPVVAD